MLMGKRKQWDFRMVGELAEFYRQSNGLVLEQNEIQIVVKLVWGSHLSENSKEKDIPNHESKTS